jgi:hypothetical protein
MAGKHISCVDWGSSSFLQAAGEIAGDTAGGWRYWPELAEKGLEFRLRYHLRWNSIYPGASQAV